MQNILDPKYVYKKFQKNVIAILEMVERMITNENRKMLLIRNMLTYEQ